MLLLQRSCNIYVFSSRKDLGFSTRGIPPQGYDCLPRISEEVLKKTGFLSTSCIYLVFSSPNVQILHHTVPHITILNFDSPPNCLVTAPYAVWTATPPPPPPPPPPSPFQKNHCHLPHPLPPGWGILSSWRPRWSRFSLSDWCHHAEDPLQQWQTQDSCHQ